MIQLRGPLTLPRPVRVEAPTMRDLSWLEIDLTALDHNVQTICDLLDQPGMSDRRTGKTGLCGVIKKDAYGLGIDQIAHRLVKAGCDMLAVYGPAEAEQLINKAITCPILLLVPMRDLSRTDKLYRHAVAEKLHLTIHDREQLVAVNKTGRDFGIRMPVHFYLDTGMSRAGLSHEQFVKLVKSLGDFPHVRLAGVYSHLARARADHEFTYAQLEQFDQALEACGDALPEDVTRHLSNSYATLRDPRLHYDMTRCGLALFGYGTVDLEGPLPDGMPELRHSVRWASRIIHVQRYTRRSPVGYGSTHKLKRDSVLGVVPIGYGDGYPLSLSNKATVRVHPRDETMAFADCKVLGQVNMDQITVDLTDLVADGDPAELLNAGVEVISADPAAPNSLPALAAIAKCHCYELLCRLSHNITRRYQQ